MAEPTAAGAASRLLESNPLPLSGEPSSTEQENPPGFLKSSSALPSSAVSSSPLGVQNAPPQTNSPSQTNHVGQRIGGWFSSILNPSNNDDASLRQSEASTSELSSPKSSPRKPLGWGVSPSSPSLTPPTRRLGSSAKSGQTSRLGPLDRFMDRAVQYFLDTDAVADKCEEDIWLLGVKHSHQRKSPPAPLSPSPNGLQNSANEGLNGKINTSRRGLVDNGVARTKPKHKGRRYLQKEVSPSTMDRTNNSYPETPSNLKRSKSYGSASSEEDIQNMSDMTSSPIEGSSNTSTEAFIAGWPREFYHDFYSRIALTYRTGFPPIQCSTTASTSGIGGVQGVLNSLNLGMSRTLVRQEGLSSDAGWGCMLRTGQCLLANALLNVHIGRDWRRSLPGTIPASREEMMNPIYSRIISLFLDDPSALAPFSVHRFALMGKRLGKDVGEWFGPSTAAGAINALVAAFPPSGLAVASFVDGTVYKSDIIHAAGTTATGNEWMKPVLVLIGLRLGIDEVNPIYYEAIKSVFEFPQSVGIAGGRPSSSYYFLGAQASSLFYIDPHHPQSAIPLRPPPADLYAAAQTLPYASSNAVPGDVVERLGNYFGNAYSDEALRSYHCGKVRKMALSSMDPSMLLGFLVKTKDDWEDFTLRHQEFTKSHKSIFALVDSPPSWMRRNLTSSSSSPPSLGEISGADDAKSVSSFSGPDDWELDSASGIEDDDEVEHEAHTSVTVKNVDAASKTTPGHQTRPSFAETIVQVDPLNSDDISSSNHDLRSALSTDDNAAISASLFSPERSTSDFEHMVVIKPSFAAQVGGPGVMVDLEETSSPEENLSTLDKETMQQFDRKVQDIDLEKEIPTKATRPSLQDGQGIGSWVQLGENGPYPLPKSQ